MSDMKKSALLRVALWLVAMAFIMPAVALADVLLDKLPIWATTREHNFIEGVFFFGSVAVGIWNWLSRRVWIGSLHQSHPQQHPAEGE